MQASKVLLRLFFLLLITSTVFAALDDEHWDKDFGAPGTEFAVTALLAVNNTVFIAGNLVSVDGLPINRIAKWDGKDWSGLGADEFVGTIIQALAWDGKRLIAGGRFTKIGGISASNIAAWDGQRWSNLGGVDGDVAALALMGTDLYVGGSFTTAGGVPANRVAKWDGTRWSSVGGGVSKMVKVREDPPGVVEKVVDGSGVTALVAHGGYLYVGGAFTNAGGKAANNIAKWDGQSWSALGGGVRLNSTDPVEGAVRALTLFKNQLIAAGDFHFADTKPATNIALWDGERWLSLAGGADNTVGALTQDGASLYAGGVFITIGGIFTPALARWDGSQWFALGSGVDRGGVTTMALQAGMLFVGGDFMFAGNKPSTNIALWHIPRSLSLQRTDQSLAISWPAADSNLVLESAFALIGPWALLSKEPTVQNNRLKVLEETSGSQKFYRLRGSR